MRCTASGNNRALFEWYMPYGARYGRGQKSLLFTHALGFCTEICYVVTHFPTDLDLVHDSLAAGCWGELRILLHWK